MKRESRPPKEETPIQDVVKDNRDLKMRKIHQKKNWQTLIQKNSLMTILKMNRNLSRMKNGSVR